MILESFKEKIKDGRFWLILLMAVIFISAGVFRLINPSAAGVEMKELGLPVALTWALAIFEIVGGIALIAGGLLRRLALIAFGVFLLFALGLALLINASGIIAHARELFVFNLSSTDFFLHFVFMIIIVSLLLKQN